MNGATNFGVSSDHGIQFSLTGAFGQIHRVFLQRFALAFRLLISYRLAAAHRIDRLLQRHPQHTVRLEQTTGLAPVIGQSQQKHLAGDKFITMFLRFLICHVE